MVVSECCDPDEGYVVTHLSMLLVSILVSSVRMARSSLLFNTLSSAFKKSVSTPVKYARCPQDPRKSLY